MIELTEQQRQALAEQGGKPLEVIDPATRETFVLVRKGTFETMRRWLKPLEQGWDDPKLDVYEECRHRRDD